MIVHFSGMKISRQERDYMKRQEIFNEKIEYFKNHPKYKWLRKYADDALTWDTMCGFYQIKAEDFIDRIISASLNYIEDWLNGKNQLEWSGIENQQEIVIYSEILEKVKGDKYEKNY